MADRTERIEVADLLGGASAASLRTAILEAGGADLVLDVGGSERISTQSLQVLLSAAITARTSGRSLTLDAADRVAPWLAQAGLTLADLQSRPGAGPRQSESGR